MLTSSTHGHGHGQQVGMKDQTGNLCGETVTAPLRCRKTNLNAYGLDKSVFLIEHNLLISYSHMVVTK